MSVWQVLKILLMILLPLAWGLGTDYAFDRWRRRWKLAKGVEDISEGVEGEGE